MEKNKVSLSYPTVQKEDFIILIVRKHKQQLIYALVWNIFESMLYHIIFLTHQAILYRIAGKEIYGKIGALFSFSFFCITLATLGLDTALIPFIRQLVGTKSMRRLLFTKHLIPHFILLLCSTPCILIVGKATNVIPLLYYYSFTTIFMLSFFIATETIRKIMRHILQFLFYNKYAALTEIGMVLLYSTLFWTGYLLGIPLDAPYAVLLPFLLLSCGSLIVLVQKIRNLVIPTEKYNELDQSSIAVNQTVHTIIIHSQWWLTLNTVTRLFFSSNLLIPLCAVSMGYMHAGIATIAHYTTHAMTFFIHKITTPLVAALFALPEATQSSSLQKSTLFVTVICFMGITLLIASGGVCIAWFTHASWESTTIQYAICFFILHTIEQLFTIYEKFFASLHLPSHLTLTNGISALMALFISYYIHSFSTLLLCFIGIRTGALLILSYIIWTKKEANFIKNTVQL